MCGGVHDVITGNKFHQNRSRGFRATGVQNWGLPLTWPVALTTVQHYRADCDDLRLYTDYTVDATHSDMQVAIDRLLHVEWVKMASRYQFLSAQHFVLIIHSGN